MSKFQLSVRARILSIALIPTIILVAVGLGASTYLAVSAFHLRDQVTQFKAGNAPATEFIQAVQQERQASMLAFSGAPNAADAVRDARARVDRAIRSPEMTRAQGTVEEVSPDTEGESTQTDAVVKALTQVRQGMDAGVAPPDQVLKFFDGFLDQVLVGTRAGTKALPDGDSVVAANVGVEMMAAIEALGRGNALALSVGGRLNAQQLHDYAEQMGSFHDRFTTLAPALNAADKQRLTAIQSSAGWQTLTSVENALVSHGAQGPDDDFALPVSIDEWQSALTTVGTGLFDLYRDLYGAVIDSAIDKAQQTATWWLVAAGALVIGVLIIGLITLRISGQLIRRLKRLRAEALSVADQHLPRIMNQLRNGEDVDVTTEMVPLDFGADEIGDVADAFNRAESAAVSAAVEEARTRGGVNALFLNIAHRSQIVVHRQLEVLDKAEHSEEDPNRLSVLFELDHLSTRARRNAENLIILGGEQPGRQWRVPVPLVDLVRSAVSETEDYSRVHTGHMAGVAVVGSVVADLIHLIAELVENATAYSPPESRVDITSNVVGRGAVVEVVDQGLGMSSEQIAMANRTLQDPSSASLANLSSDSRMGLLVVSRIAARNDVTVKLAESDYGGIRAIVIIPIALIANEEEPVAVGATTGTSPVVESAMAEAYAPVNGNGSHRFPSVPWPTMDPPAAEPPPTPSPRRPEPRHTRLELTGPQPVVSASADEPVQPTAGRPTLPRRRRQENLAPQLTNTQQTVRPQPKPGGRHERSAERARDLFAEIESGTRLARYARPEPGTNHDEGREGLR
ncbi:sensor histidine kinase [Actinophytocola oryzae]|uniref:histidine kinase n=1 Tax=Actinophytocola oryzae TaxID=502181 RepID=A0A4R7W4J7_9PSEU|nr:nitrate- and nitrite sensing domain-containing protein [Actinophytocola oryzae]TDV57626.1 signal transduction histidine kinase [Actinophytocola oryzae]